MLIKKKILLYMIESCAKSIQSKRKSSELLVGVKYYIERYWIHVFHVLIQRSVGCWLLVKKQHCSSHKNQHNQRRLLFSKNTKIFFCSACGQWIHCFFISQRSLMTCSVCKTKAWCGSVSVGAVERKASNTE